jgi:hypothetical protein
MRVRPPPAEAWKAFTVPSAPLNRSAAWRSEFHKGAQQGDGSENPWRVCNAADVDSND